MDYNWDREKKNAARKIAIESIDQPMARGLFLPSLWLLDVEHAFKHEKIEDTSELHFVESNPDIVHVLEWHSKRLTKDWSLAIRPNVHHLELVDFPIEDFEDKGFDYMFLDTCNGLSHKMADFIQKCIQHGFNHGTDIWLTLALRHGPGTPVHSLKKAIGRDISELTAIRWCIHNLTGIDAQEVYQYYDTSPMCLLRYETYVGQTEFDERLKVQRIE